MNYDYMIMIIKMEKTREKPTETRGNESLWSYHVTSQHFKK